MELAGCSKIGQQNAAAVGWEGHLLIEAERMLPN